MAAAVLASEISQISQDSECPFRPQEYATGLDFREEFLTGYEVTHTSNIVDSADDLSNYNKFGTKTYPVIIAWGYTKDTTTQKGALSEDHVTVASVHANVTMPDSQVAAGTGLKLGVLGAL
ncbi:hypothetical protein AB5N19_01150 [Seiridium cardinale]